MKYIIAIDGSTAGNPAFLYHGRFYAEELPPDEILTGQLIQIIYAQGIIDSHGGLPAVEEASNGYAPGMSGDGLDLSVEIIEISD